MILLTLWTKRCFETIDIQRKRYNYVMYVKFY